MNINREIIDLLLIKPEYKLDNGTLTKNNIPFFPRASDYKNCYNPLKYQKFPVFADNKFDIFISTNNLEDAQDRQKINDLYYKYLNTDIKVGIAGNVFIPSIGYIGLVNNVEFISLCNSAKLVWCFNEIEANSLANNNILATTNHLNIEEMLVFSPSQKDKYIIEIKNKLCVI